MQEFKGNFKSFIIGIAVAAAQNKNRSLPYSFAAFGVFFKFTLLPLLSHEFLKSLILLFK